MKKGGFRDKIRASIREIVFGTEDAIVSTLGAITGIAAGTGSSGVVVLSGAVLIVVEALSMSAGSYLSSKSAYEAMEWQRKQNRSRLMQKKLSTGETLHQFLGRVGNASLRKEILNVLKADHENLARDLHAGEAKTAPSLQQSPFIAAMVMGLFYLLGGVFPLLPYFFLPISDALLPSILLSGIVLFGLGFAKAKIVHTDWARSGLEMVAISLIAALIGFLIGNTLGEALHFVNV